MKICPAPNRKAFPQRHGIDMWTSDKEFRRKARSAKIHKLEQKLTSAKEPWQCLNIMMGRAPNLQWLTAWTPFPWKSNLTASSASSTAAAHQPTGPSPAQFTPPTNESLWMNSW